VTLSSVPSKIDLASQVSRQSREEVSAAWSGRNAMTVDVEDYYHVQAFTDVISPSVWETLPSRIERNTERLLALFADGSVTATFFTLGWVAERHPALMRRIAAAGHEIASHGYGHVRADTQTPEAFRADVAKTKAILQDTAGVAVRGYRAASFSIGAQNWWVFDILAAVGYSYSSSIYPIRHDLYGMPKAPRAAFRVPDVALAEIPLSTVRLFGQNFPCSGGGYFRLMPSGLSRWALRRVNEQERRPAVFYLHPWEIDPDQPRQKNASLKSRLRHYTNLAATEGRLRRLLKEFRWDRMDKVFADVINHED
jgi:polysaccharide deacetylase family protein (PEP-CTERM system associated)